MRRIRLSACGLALACAAAAQVKEGTITYERKINLHRRLKEEQMKAMVPEFRTNKQQLVFNDSICVYTAVQEENGPDPFEGGGGPGGRPGGGPGGGGRMVFGGMPGQDNVLYTNFSNLKIVEQTELGEKTYLILDTVKAQPWKLTDETKTVLKYTCKKATLKTARGQDVVAWYTEDLVTPAGPEIFNGLPGAVLLVDVNDGAMLLTALEVKAKADKKELKEPAKGKAITRAEFSKKIQEMFNNRGMGGPGGSRVIRIEQ
jgi:GLPGLI family protein